MAFFSNFFHRTSLPNYSHEHLIGTNKNYQKFIVVTYRRTGSNYFLDMLRSHPQIVAFSSLYEKNKLGFVYPGYPKFDCKETLKFRDHHPVDFMNKIIFRNYSEKIKAVGFKITYEIDNPEVIKNLNSIPELKIIHLQRNNLLRIYLSDMIAITTKKWHALAIEHESFANDSGFGSRVKFVSKPGDDVLPSDFTIPLDYDQCLKEFIEITNLTKKCMSYFNSPQVYPLKYENLLKDPTSESNKILDFLGVEKIPIHSRLLKINNRPLSSVISNYEELKTKFKGSEWEIFFEE